MSDPAGCLAVHLLSGTAALVSTVILGARRERLAYPGDTISSNRPWLAGRVVKLRVLKRCLILYVNDILNAFFFVILRFNVNRIQIQTDKFQVPLYSSSGWA